MPFLMPPDALPVPPDALLMPPDALLMPSDALLMPSDALLMEPPPQPPLAPPRSGPDLAAGVHPRDGRACGPRALQRLKAHAGDHSPFHSLPSTASLPQPLPQPPLHSLPSTAPSTASLPQPPFHSPFHSLPSTASLAQTLPPLPSTAERAVPSAGAARVVHSGGLHDRHDRSRRARQPSVRVLSEHAALC